MPTIQELIKQAEKRELLLPEFQRGYVWNRDQVRMFARSLYRGHPTGHFLIWRTYAPPKVRGKAPASDSYSLLLLDGQQRLTSLYVLFNGEPPPFYEGEDLFFDLYFNLQTEEFRFWQPTIMKDDFTWLSVHEFLTEGLADFIGRFPKIEPEARAVYEANLSRLAKLDAIRNYTYQADQLSGDELSTDEVVEIFNRVNSAGTPLTKADLALAHVCSTWPEAREEMRGFSRSMAQHGFPVDLTFLLRCIAAVSSGSLLMEGSFYKVPAEDLQLAWKKVRTAFEHLVNVLRHEAFVDEITDLPTVNVLIVPTVFLANNGGAFTDDALKMRFIRWIYLAGVWARYSGATETKLQKDVASLGADDPVGALIDGILAERGRIHLEAKDLMGKMAGSAEYKFSYIVARARDAKDWFTGQVLYQKAVGKSNGLESHHVFPRAVLKKAGYSTSDDRKIMNEVANRAFLTMKANRKIAASQPAQYLPEILSTRADALKAQCVPTDKSLWAVEEYPRFLAERRTLLAKAINAYLDSLIPKQEVLDQHAEEILSLVAAGEHEGLELKSTLRWDLKEAHINKDLERSVLKTIAGLLNGKEGGRLLIGAADDGQILGLDLDYASLHKDGKDDRDLFELHLMGLMASRLGEAAAAFTTITFHSVDGKDVCQVTVEPSDHPIYLNDDGQDVFFLRVGNSTKAPPLPEVIKYVGSRWGG